MAAVLGSKNVKAIAVRGKAKFSLADPKALREYVNNTTADVREGTAALHKYGTPILVNMINKMGALGTMNLQKEIFENCDPISGETMLENFLDKDTTCLKCPVACGKDYLMKGGKFDGVRWKMPEYETIFSLGTMLNIGDPGALLRANQLCDELGLDTISAGVTMALAYECFDRGLLTKNDVGHELPWGDADTMLRLLEDTAHRRGFGAQIAEGGARLADAIGGEAPEMLYAARGLELPAHSARALKGMSIGYATGTRGGQPSRHPSDPPIRLGPRQYLNRGQTRLRDPHPELHCGRRLHHHVPFHERARVRRDGERKIRPNTELDHRLGHHGGRARRVGREDLQPRAALFGPRRGGPKARYASPPGHAQSHPGRAPQGDALPARRARADEGRVLRPSRMG